MCYMKYNYKEGTVSEIVTLAFGYIVEFFVTWNAELECDSLSCALNVSVCVSIFIIGGSFTHMRRKLDAFHYHSLPSWLETMSLSE